MFRPSSPSPHRSALLPRILCIAVASSAVYVSHESDARPFGKRKVGWSSSSSTKAKQQRSERKRIGLFSRAKPSQSTAATARRSTPRPPIALGETEIRRAVRIPVAQRSTRQAAPQRSQPRASTSRYARNGSEKPSLLRRILGNPVGSQPAPRTTTRTLRGSKVPAGWVNKVQRGPKIDHGLLARGSRSGRRVVVNIAQQRAYLYVDGKVAVDTPVSTARSGKYTPRGSFRVGERVARGKISTIYHVSIPYWMRLGGSAYGMHAGYLPGYPASAGCIRMPLTAAQAIYNATAHGTSVRIVGG